MRIPSPEEMFGDLLGQRKRQPKRANPWRKTIPQNHTRKADPENILRLLLVGAFAICLTIGLKSTLSPTQPPASIPAVAEEKMGETPPKQEPIIIKRSQEDLDEESSPVPKPKVTSRTQSPSPAPSPASSPASSPERAPKSAQAQAEKPQGEKRPEERKSTSKVGSAKGQPKKILARVTVYWAEGAGSDKWSAKRQSASGVRLEGKEHAAVDPRVIPYGSHLVVSNQGCPTGKPLIVEAVDTGSAVKSRKAAKASGKTASQKSAPVIDLFFETKQEALAYTKANPPFQWVQLAVN